MKEKCVTQQIFSQTLSPDANFRPVMTHPTPKVVAAVGKPVRLNPKTA
jgi:hypothetical protein